MLSHGYTMGAYDDAFARIRSSEAEKIAADIDADCEVRQISSLIAKISCVTPRGLLLL